MFSAELIVSVVVAAVVSGVSGFYLNRSFWAPASSRTKLPAGTVSVFDGACVVPFGGVVGMFVAVMGFASRLIGAESSLAAFMSAAIVGHLGAAVGMSRARRSKDDGM